MTDEVVPTAAGRWASAVEAWVLPPHLVAGRGAPEWSEVASLAVDDPVDDPLDRSTRSSQWAREVLPPTGGTVLDVGCGRGRAALALVPPASELIGVDPSGARLDAFVAAASDAGVARRTFHGVWPEVAPITPVADVAICRGIVYRIADLVPFLVALTAHARLAVVAELPIRHPATAWNEGWAHFWQVERPSGPVLAEFVDVLHEIGLDPEFTVGPRPARSVLTADPQRLVATARRCLALPGERDRELAAWLAEHPPAFVQEVATVRWAGEGEV